jgi:hypothetical protein
MARHDAAFPSPLEGEGARRADEGCRALHTLEAWDGAAHLTLTFLLNAERSSLSLKGRGEEVASP